MIRPLLALPLVMALAACAPQVPVETSRDASRITSDLPAMRIFAGAHGASAAIRSNREIARDFLDLTFRLESGRVVPTFTRFEGRITVRVEGNAPPTLGTDLDSLLGRLRREAGIDIVRADGPSANITIEAIPRAELQRLVPQAACFVSPRIGSWAEFRTSRRSGSSDWTTLTRRERMAIFLPGDVSPQEVRDCLHEELAQALGPLNDLYRLPDSVFNDDNFHTVLTGFDMLILRTTYAPELHSGMSEMEVASRLPRLLSLLNPAGGPAQPDPEVTTPREWVQAVETALGPRTPASRRRGAAKDAVAIAAGRGWTDGRRAFSLYVLGRLSVVSDPELALASFLQADGLYRSSVTTQVQAAHVAMQLAAYALTSGNAGAVLSITDANIPVAAEAQNAALLAQLMLLRAEALEMTGQAGSAASVRSEALGWARYGFGSEGEVRARAAEIAALAPNVVLAQAR
jgi:hypothetical protein